MMLFYYNFVPKKYSEKLSQSFGYDKDLIIHFIPLLFLYLVSLAWAKQDS